MINGALLSGHLGLTLLFWEGLLCTLFGLLISCNHENPRAIEKGFALAGMSDLILMLGVAATTHAAHTGVLAKMQSIPAQGIGALGAVCLLLGALGKAGGFPFHAWIPDAAEDAPTPFAAAFPGALYTVLGGYLALRTARLYDIPAGSSVSVMLVVIGLVSLLYGAGMSFYEASHRRAIACIGVAQAGFIAIGLSASAFSAAAMQAGVSALGVCGLQMLAGRLEEPGMPKGKKRVKAVCALLFVAALAIFPLASGLFAFASTGSAFGMLRMIATVTGLFLNAFALIRLLSRMFYDEKPASGTGRAFRALGMLDTYKWLTGFMGLFGRACSGIEKGVTWVYDVGLPTAAQYTGGLLSRFDNGSLGRYLTLAVSGMLVVGVIFAIVLL
jgi:formate hydrogenlyase subunit 3/multisubunit Na+/H+ antiporter MnhD subunit